MVLFSEGQRIFIKVSFLYGSLMSSQNRISSIESEIISLPFIVVVFFSMSSLLSALLS